MIREGLNSVKIVCVCVETSHTKINILVIVMMHRCSLKDEKLRGVLINTHTHTFTLFKPSQMTV